MGLISQWSIASHTISLCNAGKQVFCNSRPHPQAAKECLYKKRMTPSVVPSNHDRPSPHRPKTVRFPPTRLASLERRKLAGRARTSRSRLRLIARGSTLELLADLLDARSARGGVDSRGVAEVGVDADEQLPAGGLDVLHHDVALGALLAVAARAVQLAEVGDLEAVDGHGARAVVLDHLVCGARGAAAGDGCVAVFLEGQGVCVVVRMGEVLRGG